MTVGTLYKEQPPLWGAFTTPKMTFCIRMTVASPGIDKRGDVDFLQ